ncbi:hypothetical protein OnM2_067052 [Erysiphe neolycopersici]|uniref:Uncharacterized protein n=1 Tax=Erysiphe neolycopersici TaxID=212602 RepID=A0A420HLZ1_9PEZI|nr:hypothetical protein OnM2_067052 [Erysiphe neolycopersici]
MDSLANTIKDSPPLPHPPDFECIDAMDEESINMIDNLSPWRKPNAKLSLPPMPYQPIPSPFGHPFMTIPNHQNLSTLPISRNELKSFLENFFCALKVENDELRKEVDNLRQGMKSMCKEMRSTFLAQRTIGLPGPISRQSNRVDNSAVDEEISVSSQVAKHPKLQPRLPTAETNTPVLPVSSIRTQILSSQTFLQTKQPKLYSQVVTVNPEKPWTVIGSSRAKSKKTQGSNSFPTPLKTPRPEHERRIIFRRRANVLHLLEAWPLIFCID